jgi:hypothetical protein
MFFYDASTGAKLGTWVLPAPGAAENCTIHNYNLVPLRDGNDVVVSGNYQAAPGPPTSPIRPTRSHRLVRSTAAPAGDTPGGGQ